MVGKISVVDLFCGVGGLTCGLQKSGLVVRCGVDIDPECMFAYTFNNHAVFLEKSVASISGLEIKKYLGRSKYSLLAGCAPCQTFSKYNPRANHEDERWNLLNHFSRLVRETNPDFVTMENVPQLLKHEVFSNFVESLRQSYFVWFGVINCVDYGLPQHRCRLVLLASRHGDISIISPKSFAAPRRCVRDAIQKLPPIKAGEVSPIDKLHVSPSLTPINLRRIRNSKPGGTWKEWPENLRLPCHRTSSGENYVSVYGRMKWDEPSPTLTTQFYGYGNGRFGHPDQDRAISLREGAILQGFPEDYEFVPSEKPVITKNVGRMIGNAVPVVLGEVIGKSILEHCKGISK